MQRNAYILSAGLHVAALALLFIMAQVPAKMVAPLQRYRPVRLVALPGRPGTPTTAQEQDKPVQIKQQPKERPALKSDAKAKPAQKPAEAARSTGAGGAGGSGARLDGANFPYPYYLSNIQIKILSNFKPTVSAREVKNLKAVVYFLVGKSGKISDVKLETKSGHFLFDQEAQRAVLRSSPLPALPLAFGSDRLGVHFEFVGGE
jgi:TonB family protein